VGIERETLEHLFEPFMQADKTLDRSMGGLGLGLALVKGLVELHGGSVSARSDGLGKGAEFTVRIPLHRGTQSEPARAVKMAKHARRVLIIEDNVDAATSLSEALELSGHCVVVAHNGPEGIAKAHECTPEVVLCDIGLPGLDGYAIARAFRGDERLSKTYLVALSGYALPEDVQRATDAGFHRHVSKPPNLEKLEQLLAEVEIEQGSFRPSAQA
jgi:two-component system CheB/CheR fusion protein